MTRQLRSARPTIATETQQQLDPLDQLTRRLEQGVVDAGEPPQIDPPDRQTTDDPLIELRDRIQAEIDELGARSEPLGQPAQPSRRSTTANGIDPVPGESDTAEELLRALTDEPLSGEARARVARRLASIADNPTPDAVREALAIVVQDVD